MQAAESRIPRLEMRGIQKSFGATRALSGVDLEVFPGEVLSLVGENGAGKSTLMKILSGAQLPDSGEMRLNQAPYRPTSPLDARESGVAMIYQELTMTPQLSITENILLGVETVSKGLLHWKEMDAQAVKALKAVGLEQLHPRTRVGDLSVAEQQRIEIARAINLQSSVLVLDEPTSSLGKQEIERLFTLIRGLRDQGVSIIYISHFMEEITEISDRFTVLRDGETVGSGVTRQTQPDEIVSFMVGREVESRIPRTGRKKGEGILEVKDLSGQHGCPVRCSLSLHRGEILGICGLVGAGRTEFLRCLFGMDELQTGEIRVGAFSGQATPQERWQQGVGMVSENRKEEGLALGLSIAENMTLPKLTGLGPKGLVLPESQRKASQPWIKKLPIKCASASQRVGGLSGGNQQKVAIARLLYADVDVLLLDEPTRGIDVGSKAQIYQVMDEVTRGNPDQEAKAILMVSSYLPELMDVCDRIAVMRRGRLVEVRPVSEWTEQELMVTATGKEETV